MSVDSVDPNAPYLAEVSTAVNGTDCDKIKKLYTDILYYHSEDIQPEDMKSYESKLYGRFIELKKESATFSWKFIILTFGFGLVFIAIKKWSVDREIKNLMRVQIIFNSVIEQRKNLELIPKPASIRDLEKRRQWDIDQELARLKANPRINNSLKVVNLTTKKQQVAYGHSLELQEQLKDTHYVINHGQNMELMVLNIASRKLKELIEKKCYFSFEPLRHDVFLTSKENVDWFKEKLKVDTDHQHRNALICGDCWLESTEECESAISFFSKESNISCFGSCNLWVTTTLNDIFNKYLPHKTSWSLSEEIACKAASSKGFWGSVEEGNLYSICVPKDKFKESCFFTKACGRSCNEQDRWDTLSDIQSGNLINPPMPQIRLLAHKIRPEDGYHVILNSTFNNEQLINLEVEIGKLIDQAFQTVLD